MKVRDTGYSIVEGLFSPEECDSLATSLSHAPRSRAGTRHLMSNESVVALANDRRLIDLAANYLAGAAIPFRATLFDKSPDSNWLIPWHQDTALPLTRRHQAAGWGPWSTKGGVIYAHAPATALSKVIALRLHLDASHAGNGPLRVIPGSHQEGVLSDERVADMVRQNESVECLVQLGGVIAMRPLIIHASSKAHSQDARRVLHLEYVESLRIVPDMQLAVA